MCHVNFGWGCHPDSLMFRVYVYLIAIYHTKTGVRIRKTRDPVQNPDQ